MSDWRDIIVPRRTAGQYERGRAVLGEPGIGKSVLVRRIARMAGESGHLVIPPISIPRGGDTLQLTAAAVVEAVEGQSLGERLAARAGTLMDRVKEVRAGVAVSLTSSSNPPAHISLRDALITVGALAQEDGRIVLLHLDEIQNVHDAASLSQLLIAIGDALVHTSDVADAAGNPHERVNPLAVYLTGLREFTERAASAAGATFTHRFKPLILTHLEDVEVRSSLAPFTGDGWPLLDADSPSAVTMTAPALDALNGDDWRSACGPCRCPVARPLAGYIAGNWP